MYAILNTTARALSLTQGLLALIGLATVLAVAWPASREGLLQHVASLAAGAPEAAAAVAAAPSVPAGAPDRDGAAALSPVSAEQHALAQFISRRYRVAGEASLAFVRTAYEAGRELQLDPLLILAIMAIESGYNPVAQSSMGALGLMQVIPRFHPEKLEDYGGDQALLDPEVNIRVGALVLHEYLRRFGELEAALQKYAGAFHEPTAQYATKVLAEKVRLERVLQARSARREA